MPENTRPAPWDDPAVAVIFDHWCDEHPGEADPSWPSVASKALNALEAAGFTIVEPGDRVAE